jgi:putative membrane protein insertion efficiency factor
MKNVAINFIEIYQKYLSFDTGVLRILAPGGACRYQITCSQYTKEMIEEYGILKGGLLGLKRIISCNPFTT